MSMAGMLFIDSKWLVSMFMFMFMSLLSPLNHIFYYSFIERGNVSKTRIVRHIRSK